MEIIFKQRRFFERKLNNFDLISFCQKYREHKKSQIPYSFINFEKKISQTFFFFDKKQKLILKSQVYNFCHSFFFYIIFFSI